MKRTALVIALIASLLNGNVATAAVKAGAACGKAGTTSTSAGKKYTCVKSGKKLVWDKGILVKKIIVIPESQKPVPTPETTPAASTKEPVTPQQNSNSGGTSFDNSAILQNLKFVEMDSCKANSDWVIGKTLNNVIAYLSCGPDLHLHPDSGASKIDQKTGLPIIDKTNAGTASIIPIIKPISNKKPTIESSSKGTLSDVAKCKIPNGNQGANFSTGFNMPAARIRLNSNPVVQVVAIDFPNLQAKDSPTADHKNKFDVVSAYWKHISAAKYQLKFNIPDTYIRMPKNIEEYKLGGNLFAGSFDGNSMWQYVQAALNQTDSSINFSGAQVIAVVTPKETTSEQIGTLVAEARNEQPFTTNEANFLNVFIAGNNDQGENSLIWGWTHEFGHFMGMEDLRDVTNPGAQNSKYLGVFDLFSANALVELLGWSRYLLGALDDSQVFCIADKQTNIQLIHPVAEESSDEKIIVIPTSTYKAIIIESRRQLGYDGNLAIKDEGALVYTLDTTIKHGLSPVTVVGSPRETDHQWRTDSTLLVGESVTVDGWKISNLESGDFGDVIKVEKAG